MIMNSYASIPIWQIVIMVICSLAGLVSMLSQFIIAGMIRRLNRHSDKLEVHQDKITKLEGSHENGSKNISNMDKTLTEIRDGLSEQNKRLTDFIIEYHKNKNKEQ